MSLSPSQSLIYTLLLESGGRLKRQELQQQTPFKQNAFRARLSELKKKGLIDFNKEEVWVVKEIQHEQENNEQEELKNKLKSLLDGGIVLERKREGNVTATIIISDTHFGDENVMIETYQSTVNNLIWKLKQISQQKPIDNIIVVLNGDVVAGRHIFYMQEAQNIFNKGNIQVLYATAFILDLHHQLSEITPEIQYFVIKGNHDNNRGDNYAWGLADKLRSLGLDAYYSGHQLIMNLGNDEKEHWALIEHGYGGSDYYPISYDFLRNTQKKLLWLNRHQRLKGRAEIERVIVGHSHWLVTNIRQDTYWAIDVSGGFQRNERVELGKNQRAAGFILYVFDPEKDGLTIYDWKDGLRLYEITPDEDVMLKELTDPALELKNRMLAPQKLMQLYNYLVENGLIKKEIK